MNLRAGGPHARPVLPQPHIIDRGRRTRRWYGPRTRISSLPRAAGPNESLPERLAYSVAEAVLLTRLSRDLLYDQLRSGKLAYLKVGRRRVITRTELQTFLSRAASWTTSRCRDYCPRRGR